MTNPADPQAPRDGANPPMDANSRRLAIMGIRGFPAAHGGFETFAAQLAPYLAAAGWSVTVYCQEDDTRPVRESFWRGVRRIHIGVGPDTTLNTVRFDWNCISHALTDRPSLVLTLGYNTAAFNLRLRLAGIANVINMDGIEWSRQKWGPFAKAWLYLNDWAGCLTGNQLIADHPEIARHLRRRVSARKITTIPYGADAGQLADDVALRRLRLAPNRFVTLIARPEPENSVLEIVEGFSARHRNIKLVVLGRYDPERFPYHAEVLRAASDEVVFMGAIYAPAVVQALRQHCLMYAHGHRVGGTNPSLLEAMGSGNPVIAHDNRFNRWVAGTGAEYFSDAAECSNAFSRLLSDAALRERFGAANRERARQHFAWSRVLGAYEALLAEVDERRRSPTLPAALGEQGWA